MATKKMICIPTLSGYPECKFEYGEAERNMAFWEFLVERIYPVFQDRGLFWDSEGVSLRGWRFMYTYDGPEMCDLSVEPALVKRPGQHFMFDYGNRLLKLGRIFNEQSEVLKVCGVMELGGPPAVLADGYNAYVGNAVEYDSRVECCVCLDISPRVDGGSGLTNFCLSGCKHRFHRKCVGALQKAECPMCRQGFEFRDLVLFAFFKSLPSSLPSSDAPPSASSPRA